MATMYFWLMQLGHCGPLSDAQPQLGPPVVLQRCNTCFGGVGSHSCGQSVTVVVDSRTGSDFSKW